MAIMGSFPSLVSLPCIQGFSSVRDPSLHSPASAAFRVSVQLGIRGRAWQSWNSSPHWLRSVQSMEIMGSISSHKEDLWVVLLAIRVEFEFLFYLNPNKKKKIIFKVTFS
jgi:hypothetical protein